LPFFALFVASVVADFAISLENSLVVDNIGERDDVGMWMNMGLVSLVGFPSGCITMYFLAILRRHVLLAISLATTMSQLIFFPVGVFECYMYFALHFHGFA